MVAKMIALYKHPANQQAFNDKFYNEHIPLAHKMPGLQLVEISKACGAPVGVPAFYLMTEFYFNDMEAVKAGISSPEGQATLNNITSFAGELVHLLFAEVHEKG
jgi:uncharacterized protein (TIGR02118 family)